MSGNKTFKVGLIGSGRIARVHCLALRVLPNVEVLAVASRSPENAKRFAAECDIPICHASAGELCENKEIHAVHICNANMAHLESIHAAVKNNKAILCEKPLTHSQTAINEVLRLTQKQEQPFAVCYSYRYHPTALLLARHLPEIGAVRSVEISYLQSSWLLKRLHGWKPDTGVYGDSYVLSDIGSHAIDMAQHLLQSPLIFKEAVIQYDGKKNDCSDIAATVQLLARGNIPVTLTVSKSEEGIHNQFKIRLVGELGELGTEHLLEERVYFIQKRKKRWIHRTPDLDGDVLRFPAEHPEGWLSGFVNLFSFFYRQMAGEKIAFSLPSFHESVQIANLIGQILREGCWKPKN